MPFSRREFVKAGSLLTAGFLTLPHLPPFPFGQKPEKAALDLPHFPDKLHAFVWRNWNLVPLDRLATVVQAKPQDLIKLARAIGLPASKSVSKDQQQRSYLTIIRRNWHLLPREQLLQLLGWTDEQLTFTLQEDDFFYIKLGSLKPECAPIRFQPSSADIQQQQQRLSRLVRDEFPTGFPGHQQPLFEFVRELSAKLVSSHTSPVSGFSPRFGYAYFALFGDPLLQPDIDPYPDGYLSRMAASGLDGTWMHIVLSKITPFPWDPAISEHWEKRLDNLAKLVQRAQKHGIGIYLYLNEPRFLPLSFFEKHPELKGVTIGEQAALCTSHPDVQQYLVDSMTRITTRVPDLAGFFSITASENPTNCWSHGKGADCPRCSKRSPAEVIAELNGLYQQGIQKGFATQETRRPETANPPALIAWDWGWKDGWAEDIIPKLPKTTALMSVSEWDLPIERGGVKNKVGEYSISAIGPGPRARRHWETARRHGLKTIAKIQAGNTWEIAAVPYIPALENVAQHAENLRGSQINGLMMGWTLGGYPSPNLEVVAEIGSNPTLTALQALQNVSQRRYGPAGAAVTTAWQQFSKAFREFPYEIGVVYSAPLQVGAANLLWAEPTGYKASMVGLPYDDVKSWKASYPVEVFTGQLQKVADGFYEALNELRRQTATLPLTSQQRRALTDECNVAETVAIHYSSIANQTRFITIRDQLSAGTTNNDGPVLIQTLTKILQDELTLAKRMATLQGRDSRLGFEASNHYFYVCNDLAEKVINCRYLLDIWLPELKKRF